MPPIDSKNNLTTSKGFNNYPAWDEGREDEKSEESPFTSSSSSTDVGIYTDTIEAQPIDRTLYIIPIPRDDPTLVFAEFERIILEHDKPVEFPFPKSSSTKGAYILFEWHDLSSRQLIFKFTSSSREKTIKHYTFPIYGSHEWFYLPIDLPDIARFVMIVEDSGEKAIRIDSLVFVREETPEESTAHKFKETALEKLWSEATIVTPKFMNEGDRYSIPIPRDDPTIFNPSYEMVNGSDYSYSKELSKYNMSDKSWAAQRMLKGEVFLDDVTLSHLSIPFPAPSSMKGACICVYKNYSSPSLLFSFTLSDGKKTSKKYEFSEPKHEYEWHFLPIDLDNVVLCEIDGKGTWKEKTSRVFNIESLVFIREETWEERTAREVYEHLWTESTIFKPKFMNPGKAGFIPIPRDDPTIIIPSFELVKGKNDSMSLESEEHDKSSEAHRMLKGEGKVSLSHLSIPFPSPSPMKGAYICVDEDYSSPSLLFTFTLSDGKKTFKKYEFTKPKHDYEWHFLPIDLDNVVLCEIQGKGTWEEKNSRSFQIESLIFITGDDIPPLPSDSSKLVKHDSFTLTSSATITPQCIIGQGGFGEVLLVEVEGIPIPCVLKKMLRKTDEKVVKTCRDLDNVILCEIDGKGTWKEKNSRVFNIESLVFIREETYEERTAREVHERCWTEATISKPEFMNPGNASFIPIPRDDPDIINPSFELVKAKDESRSKESDEYDMSSEAQRMLKGERKDYVFLTHLSIPFPSPSPIKGAYICFKQEGGSPYLLFTFTLSDGEKTSKKYEFTEPKHDYEWFFLSIDLDNVILCEIEGKGTWKEEFNRDFFIYSLVFLKRHIYTKEVTFVHEGGYSCIPIPRDAPNIIDPEFGGIEARNGTGDKVNRSESAKRMIKGEYYGYFFTHISIPFKPPSTPIKGAYICLPSSSDDSFPIHLIFTFTSSTGNVRSIKYNFDDIALDSWFFLPIELSDVVLCEIEGESKKEGKKRFEFSIESLAFIREETVEEEHTRKSTEVLISKMWTEASTIIAEFIAEGDDDSRPIPRDDPLVINPSFELVKGKNDYMSKESEEYDMSSDAQEMLIGEDDDVVLSHLSIPFLSPSPMKGAYICVEEDWSSPSLLFSFTLSNGKKISKKYEFTDPEHEYEWHFLPIDLPNVILCEIQGKGTWKEKNSRCFEVESLIFITGDDIPPLPSDSSKLIKHDSFTLTSSATITPQCIIGHGGFGEVILVKVEGIPIPCVLKKMLKIEDKKVIKTCRDEFKVQRKLFNNPTCFNRIPRPLYILDLLDADLQGIYGFLMEFCIGGSVSSFAKKWCVVEKSESQGEEEEEELSKSSSDSEGKEEEDLSDSFSSSEEEDSDDHKQFDPMTLNPVKVSALCVGMIECLDDVFTAKLKLIHRDIKPDNFLVRVDPDSKKCTVVLSDLGLVKILDSISSSTTTKSGLIQPIHLDTKKETQNQTPSKCGTLVYNSYETLLAGTQTQKSDGYSLGMSILALFICEHPFVSLPLFREVVRKHLGDDFRINLEIMGVLMGLMEKNMSPKLNSISSSTTTKSGLIQPIHLDTKKETQNQTPSKCGTLVYNSYETLLAGTQTQKSDGYSLGMSILALFICEHPFVSLPLFREVVRKHLGDDFRINLEIMGVLMGLMEKNMSPKLSQSHLFKSLLTIEGGKFQPVHECLNEVFTGLTQLDVDKRMSVHKAREKVQSIKHLLPEIGEGFECPSVDDIIKEQKQKHFGSGTIIGGPMSHSEVQESTIKSHDIVNDREHDESEKESEEKSGRDMGHGTQSMSSKLQSTENDNRDMPSYMLHQDERDRGTSNHSEVQNPIISPHDIVITKTSSNSPSSSRIIRGFEDVFDYDKDGDESEENERAGICSKLCCFCGF
ncbi:hypothetical protein ADUPG1_000212 [Aduncisulcus paluster]|uniref:Protein kinase domain-containing protein n=1 Tax=Aduncisulcus paluster TaxID=2918883 RepID=A0ABQ5KAB2_9EUKA|nr:hypothetical protein ADUPG1_000212 [Aduncisulcus paluster]